MKWFEGINNLKELHKKLIRLAKKYHPDVGGDTKTMQSINAEYDEMRDTLTGGNFMDTDFADVGDVDFTYTDSTGFNDSDFTSEYYASSADYSEFKPVEDDEWFEFFAKINSVKSDYTEWLKEMFGKKNDLESERNEIVRDRKRLYRFIRQRGFNRRRNCRAV